MMDVPLSNEDIQRELEEVEGFRGVVSYDLLPRLGDGEFCVVNTDNVVPIHDYPEGGHHWLTVCRENDQVLVFDSFGRSLAQMEQDYTEPHFKRYFIEAYPECEIVTNTQILQDRSTAVCGHYAILVGKLFTEYGIDKTLAVLRREFTSDTLANDRTMVGGGWTDRLADELHRQRRVHFPRRRVIVKGIDQIWSADLVDMRAFSKYNKGIRYLLNVIDVLSKYAWSVSIKDKTGEAITKAFRSITKTRKPKMLWVDRGTEFYNRTFRRWLNEQDIQLYSTENEGKAVVVERFNRTLKSKMWRYFSDNSTNVYIDVLQELVERYNNTKHRSIGMTPTEASLKSNEQRVLYNLYKDNTRPKQRPRFEIGDRVRITVAKRHFEKGYTPNWTEEVFVIHEILPTNPTTYRILDLADEPIIGNFYEQQMQKAVQDTFRIEKVIRKRKDQALVKWKGYPDKFNSWVSLDELKRLN